MTRAKSFVTAGLMCLSMLGGVTSTVQIAHAAADAQAGRLDGRVRTFTFRENEVFRFTAGFGVVTMLEFEQGEQVTSVQMGNAEAWEVQVLGRGDTIALKPLLEDSATNMIVITNRGRVYTFELTARQFSINDQNQAFRVKFRYPSSGQGIAGGIQQFSDASRPTARDNVDYYASGQTEFRPQQVWDNGQFTFFKFPRLARHPAFFVTNAEGQDSLVSAIRVSDDVVKVARRSDRWTLRLGDQTICIFNGIDTVNAWRLRDSEVVQSVGR